MIAAICMVFVWLGIGKRKNNFYLISLYSISKDLDNTKFSALKEFKQVRNAMEHKIFKISSEEDSNLKKGIYNRNELIQKTKLLLLYSSFFRSCIEQYPFSHYFSHVIYGVDFESLSILERFNVLAK